MPLNRNKLYIFLIISCVAGYVWVFINYTKADITNKTGVVGCIIKNTTNIPCPSCGSTRSVLSLLDGDFLEALYWNPIGIVLVSIMVITPIWIISDLFIRKDTLFRFYKKTEEAFKEKRVVIPAIILILINWIWNFYKGL